MEFVREQRVPVPSATGGDVPVTAPPKLPKSVPGNPVARLLPVAMLVACVGMMAVYFTSGAASPRNPMFMFFPVMMAMSVLGSLVYSTRGGLGRTAEIDAERRKYLRYLDSLDADLRVAAENQHRAEHWRHPEPGALWSLAGSRRMWERRPDDPDFCRVRIGMGEHRSRPALIAPELASDDELDPVTVSAMRRLLTQRSVVDALPVSVPLRQSAVLTIEGDHNRARAMVRAMVCQLALWHGPDDVGIAAVVGPTQRKEWEWLKWLPHHQHPHDVDAVGAARLVYSSLERAVAAQPGGRRHTVVIVDGGATARLEPASDDVTVVEIGTTLSAAATRLRVDGDGVAVGGDDGAEVTARPDALTQVQAAVCARRLAPYRLGTHAAQSRQPVARDWLELAGITDLHGFDIDKHWAATGHMRLVKPVPIGVAEDGAPVVIDINEAARGGIGPHGLCVGATGSGKSEFLRTLVLGMITAHPPDQLNLVLVDFKGGATFLGMNCQVVRVMIGGCAQRSTPASATTRPAAVSASHAN